MYYLLNHLVGGHVLLLLAVERLCVVARHVLTRHLVLALHEGQLPAQAGVLLPVIPALFTPTNRPRDRYRE